MFKPEAKNNAILIWDTMKKAKQHNKLYTLNEFKNDMDLLIKCIELYNTDASYIIDLLFEGLNYYNDK